MSGRSRRDMVLHALGFRGREDQTARSLSGGEKTRLGLAQLLMAQPDVLLLDEPTNHLDIAMRGWLEGYLSRYPGAVLIVSHDREMLDRACSSTAEIARGTLTSYTGTPSAYRAYREEQLKIEAATRKNQQQEHERLEAAATRMKKWAGQNEKLHRRAKAMFRRLERYEDTMLDEAEQVQGATRFQFESGASGEVVLQAQHLSKAFGEKQLFEDVGFHPAPRGARRACRTERGGEDDLFENRVGRFTERRPTLPAALRGSSARRLLRPGAARR